MRTLLAGCVCSIAMAGATFAEEVSAFEISLFQDYDRYNTICRGTPDDGNLYWQACGARDYVAWLLGEFDWCYGKESDFGYQMEWHRCAEGSNLSLKPSFR